jgi:uncharacterized protein (TIGR01244 family)
MFRQLTPDFWVSEQITLDDVDAAAAEGVTRIINNRPEGESADQTPGDAIAAAAAKHGIAYVAIPVTQAGFSQPQITAMLDAIGDAAAPGKTLAYCRSGTRSTLLWALAQSWQRENGDALTATAANAGYDLSPIRAMMDMLANRPEE